MQGQGWKTATIFWKLALGLVTGVFSACSLEPRAVSQSVSAHTLGRLEAEAASLDELAVKRTASGYEARGTWGADANVEIPMAWHSGLPHVRARVNGHEVEFILDSGSQGTVLEADTALTCGVRTARTSEGDFTLVGISGSEPARMGMPGKVEIGDWHWEGMPCFVRTTQSAISGAWPNPDRRFSINVLGMDVLRRMCAFVTLDYPGKKVRFGFRESFQPDAGRRLWQVPMEVKNGLCYVRVGDGKNEWQTLIDTGSSSCVEISQAIAERSGIVPKKSRQSVYRIGVGASKENAGGKSGVVRIPSLELLGPRLLSVPTLVVPDCAKIGSGLLCPFRVTLDFKRSVLWLESSSR